MSEETVRYERLRPAQIVARREACPVAYLPIGTIEWHGEHNPVGLDTIKMHALLERCAQQIGGLVFPPLYYGEHREQALMEANAMDRDKIAEKMHLPPSNFDPGYMYHSVEQQNTNYHHLLLHIMHEIKSLGFRVLVIGAGHYPLLDHARAAVAVFHQTQDRPKMIAWAMTGYELVSDQFQPCGDHAGKWETSLLMHLDPGMQDLSTLPTDRSVAPIGASNNGIQDANAEFGRQAVEAIVAEVKKRIDEFLAHPERYQGHGAPM
ncbi:MAG: creatininase family protein [Chloroflexi bacterium]|jgi:creatinine amidohydrolase|nr:creatininase family protein [Chloroflexota bacterium]